jgi:hypothetical protein
MVFCTNLSFFFFVHNVAPSILSMGQSVSGTILGMATGDELSIHCLGSWGRGMLLLQGGGGGAMMSSQTIVFSILVGVVFGALSYIGYHRRKKQSGPLDPVEYREFPLVERTVVSHNTRKFRFALPNSEATLNLPLGKHVYVKAIVDNKEVSRPYTPISPKETKGYFELLIKVIIHFSPLFMSVG